MITIKFPKKPLTPQRRQAVKIGESINKKIIEDEFYFIYEFEDYESALKIVSIFGGYSSQLEIFVNGVEIYGHYFVDINNYIKSKKPLTDLDWLEYEKSRFDICYHNLDLNKLIEMNNKNILEISDFDLENLNSAEFIEVIERNKKYLFLKDKLKEDINKKIKIVKILYPQYDEAQLLELIEKIPNEINISYEESKGEEWIDWYNPIKYYKESLELLRKIEENTRK